MKKILTRLTFLSGFVLISLFISSQHVQAAPCTYNGATYDLPACSDVIVQTGNLGFKIPSFADILTFAIRFFFTVAGIAALFMLLLGALEWVTSGGAKENIQKARDKIQAAVVGMIVLVLVLAIIWTMENVVFQRKICFGLSCPVTIPGLIQSRGAIPVCVEGTACKTAAEAAELYRNKVVE